MAGTTNRRRGGKKKERKQNVEMEREEEIISSATIVKSEPVVMDVDVPSSAPPVPTSSTVINDDDDDDDEVVREIDVFISPTLADQLHVIQFPLQPRKSITKNRVMEARVRPQHCILELDVSIPQKFLSTNRQVPEVLNLSQRTLVGTPQPAVTHMAMGKLNEEGTQLHLIPCTQPTYQMRPSMSHVDRAILNEEDDVEEETNNPSSSENKIEPIAFQKKDSERAILAKRSSYAYLKASRESEEWIHLTVCPHSNKQLDEDEEAAKNNPRTQTLNKIPCSRPNADLMLYGSNTPSTIQECSTQYIKSLNYLPQVIDMSSTSDMPITISDEDESSSTATTTWKRDLVSQMTHIFQSSGAVPVPYNVVRAKYPMKVTDQVLLEALSANAYLVRGNFILKSSLLYNDSTTSQDKMMDDDTNEGSGKHKKRNMSANMKMARDIVLLLFQQYGWIQRHLILRMFEDWMTEELLHHILHKLARKTKNGMELRIDDDISMPYKFPQIVHKHQQYWDKKTKQYQSQLQLYEELLREEEEINQPPEGTENEE